MAIAKTAHGLPPVVAKTTHTKKSPSRSMRDGDLFFELQFYSLEELRLANSGNGSRQTFALHIFKLCPRNSGEFRYAKVNFAKTNNDFVKLISHWRNLNTVGYAIEHLAVEVVQVAIAVRIA